MSIHTYDQEKDSIDGVSREEWKKRRNEEGEMAIEANVVQKQQFEHDMNNKEIRNCSRYSTGKQIFLIIAFLILGLIVGYYCHEDSNSERKYSVNGLPANCRALIYENQADYILFNKFTKDELLESIFRNCGETGHLWKE